MNAQTDLQSRPVWDIFIRLFHWSLAGSLGFAWWSAEQGGNWMIWHMYAGYTVLSLILFRLIWGIVGSPYARFRQFVRSPGQTLVYLRDMLLRREPHYAGHNPAGGWMVVVLLALCLAQGVTGLFANDDIMTEGPLVQFISYDLSLSITSWHHLFFNLLMAAVGLHLLGVFYHQRLRNEPLIQGMLHGRKPALRPAYCGEPAPFWKGALTAGVSALLFLVLFNLS